MKQPSIPVLTSSEDLAKTVTEIHDIQQTISDKQKKYQQEKRNLEKQLEKLATNFESEIKPHLQKLTTRVEGVFTYVTLHRHELLKKDVKTLKLATGLLEWKFTPPKTNIVDEDAALQWMLKRPSFMRDFVQTKYSIKKAELLKDPKRAVKVPGVSITQGEIFTIKPHKSKTLSFDVEMLKRHLPVKEAC
jgi:phage host-nuclease inhibitor protein Gam